MKSLKIVLALVLASNVVLGSAYAQSALRADEIKAAPEEYRLGDSNDLEKDQMIVDQKMNQRQEQVVKHQQHVLKKHLIKYGI